MEPSTTEEHTMSSTTPTRYVLTIGEDQYGAGFAIWFMLADGGDRPDRPDLHSDGFLKPAEMPTDRDGWLALVASLQPARTRLLTAEPIGHGWEAGARITWVTA